MKKFIHFLISITVFIQTFPVFASADALYDEPNDTLFFRQWYYDATKAYTYRNNGIDGKGVKVGIIDSGLNTFLDFDGVDIQTGINVCALIDNKDEKLYNTEDSGHHGTNVTSIICAKSDNDYGIAGLTDGCTLVPYKMEDFDCSSLGNSGYATIVAIELAYRNGCDVVNISRGSDSDIPQSQIDLQNQIIDKAIQNGMIIVAATGNSGKNGSPIEYPANCDNVIGVGGLEPNCEKDFIDIDLPESYGDRNDIINLQYTYPQGNIRNLADNEYSRYASSTANESVFVSAPGTNFTLPSFKNGTVSCWGGGSGTSYATPIVAAAAIGAKQMRPYIDVDMFKEILIATSTDLDAEGYDINTGYGMVNFEKIYEYVSQMPLTAPEHTPNVQVDYENGKLTNFCPNREYTINGVSIGTPEYDDSILGIDKNIGGNMDIPEEWYGTTIEIVKKASSDAYTDSEPQLLEIPTLPEPPTIGELTIDYANERLYGLESGKEYTVNGKDVALTTFVYPTTGTGFEIADDWFGTTITVAIKDTDTSKDIAIPARPEVTGLSGDKSMIIGTTANMQYRKQGSTTWRNCSDGSTRVSFSSGTAEVYIKATDVAFKSDIVTVVVGAVATPTPEVTSEPTATPTTEPTQTPIVTLEPTATPTAKPTQTPIVTSEPTIKPTEPPVTSFLPTIDYENGRIIGLDSTQKYTVNGEDVTVCTYPTGEIGFDIDELWYGKTIILAVKGTDEVRQITVQFADEEQYELETNIEYNSETGECVYSAVNNTIWTINATGIIAVYGSNGVLKHLETVDTFHTDGVNEKLKFTFTDGDTVKWFVWDSLQSMQPRDKVKLSECIVELDETE